MKKASRFISLLIVAAMISAVLPVMPLSLYADAPPAIALTGHDLNYSSLTYLDPNFEVVYTGTITSGKIYIDDHFSAASNDTLSCTNTSLITGSYIASTGILSFSGSATASDYQAFIRNVKFSTSATSGTRTVVVSLTTSSGSIVYYSATGHYYEYVPTSGLTWTQARDAAAARSYQGETGYLVTVTTAGENAFVAAKCEGDGWMGGTDQGHDKEWYWVTGPEAGSKFCQQNAYTSPYWGVGVAYTVDGWYQYFANNEPNDWKSGGNGTADGENYLHMYSANGSWNDYAVSNTSTLGYLVEYGTSFLSAAGSVVSINVTITDDAIAPTINGVNKSPTGWTNQSVTLTVDATDAGSGISSYSFDGGSTWQAESSKTYANNTTIAAGTIKVKDAVGNIATYDTVVTISNIDKTAPTITSVTANPSTLTDQSVMITVNATDNESEIAGYSFNYGIDWQNEPTQTYVNNTTIPATSIRVKDNAGNISTYASSIIINYIDRTNPVIESVSSTQLLNAASVKAVSSKQGKLYLVPKGRYYTYQDVLNASTKSIASCLAGTETEILTGSLPSGDYQLFALDLLNHMSESVAINIKYSLVNTDPGAVKPPSTATSSSASSVATSSAATSSVQTSSPAIIYKQTDEEKKVSAEGLDKAVNIPEKNNPEVNKIEVELVVEPVKETTKPNFVIVAENELSEGSQDIISLFDISLMKTIYKSGSIESKKIENSDINGMITIRLPVDDAYQDRIGLSVIYIDDKGAITKITSKLVEINSKKYLEFQTNHFSAYAIVANQEGYSPNTGDSRNLLAGLSLTLLLIVGSVFFLQRKEEAASE